MAVNLRLDKRTDEVFSEYDERIVSKAIVFEGTLLPQNARASDRQVIWFLSGGSRYVSYELERDGAYVKGVIRYRPLQHANPRGIDIAIAIGRLEEVIGEVASDEQVKAPKRPGKKRAVDDELAKTIRDMYRDGETQVSIAKKFYLNKKTVNFVVNKKGAYAE